MRNFIKPGKMLTCTAPSGGVVAGTFYKIGNIFGVVATSATEGNDFELEIGGGVFEMPKNSAEAWNVGDAIYATSGGIMTTTVGSNTKVGACTYPAANPSGSGHVRFNSNF